MHWYEIENISTIASPALVIYKERVHENIRQVIDMVNGDVARLRPHVKTNKMAEVCQLMMNAGICKFKCATIAEAEMLAMIAAPDVLLAYQPVGPNARRFIQLMLRYPATQFSCVVDNIRAAEQLSFHCIAADVTANIFIDLNTGMNRTGVLPSKALVLFEAIQLLPAIKVIGLHAYDGHIREQNLSLRQQQVEQGFNNVIILAETIEAIAHTRLKIVAGGSPTFPLHAKRTDVECSPGTFVFWDWGYRHSFPDEPFKYAALVIARVISVVDENTITIDLGHKSIAAENPLPRVHFLNVPEAVPVAQSEEHLVMKVSDSALFNIGDVMYGVPLHICPTVALYEKAMVAENHRITAEWKVVARDRMITI